MGCKESIEEGRILKMREGERGKTEKNNGRGTEGGGKRGKGGIRKCSEVAWMWEELA